ncbi:methyltransferase domain-containing protein [Nocardia asteroides]|uniref:methyltransferase domain-containing protein n=1 Tax=Nocardia asteroides TaxID=1824 RepID=UPI001E5DF62A|nr:methyltransferase domain-containing protein [Nocardia asteroides]UGT65038.1 methyltransferase domain-containing protein [Nocardia asteroides]
MTTDGLRPDRFDREGHDQLVDVRDLQAALPGIHRLRTWAHEALALAPGERAVDIGSGTGSEVFAFADAVGPTGTAIGVEPDQNLLASAQRRATELGAHAEFHPGDAYGVPFRANSFDAVLCERVFQHLTTPLRAAREIERVLRPGGRAVVTDVDWGTAILHPGARDITREVIETLLASTTNPLSGRRLPGLLTKAGLHIDDIGSHALVQERAAAAGSLVTKISAMAVARGRITEAQRDELLAELARGAETGDIHLSVTMFAVFAHKPEDR